MMPFFSSVSSIYYLAYKRVESVSSTNSFQIEKIRVSHDGTGAGAGWFLDEVRILVPNHGKNFLFSARRWLDKDEADGKLEVELEPSSVQNVAKSAFDISNFLTIPVLCIVLSLVMALKIDALSFSSGKGTNNSLMVVLATGWGRSCLMGRQFGSFCCIHVHSSKWDYNSKINHILMMSAHLHIETLIFRNEFPKQQKSCKEDLRAINSLPHPSFHF